MGISSYNDHYEYAKQEAEVKLKDRIGENNYNKDSLASSVKSYCEAYAEIHTAQNGYDQYRYRMGTDSEIQNWSEARKFYNENTPDSFYDTDFQDALFNKFFEPDPDSGTNENGEPNGYIPNSDSPFVTGGEPTLPPGGAGSARQWLKDGAGGNYVNPWEKYHDMFGDAENTQPHIVDPLLVDLDGDGIETTSVLNGKYFDHEGDGFAESSAWVGKDDGILAFDKNNNGFIDNGNEIFGDNYIKSNGSKSVSGFDALSDLDSNRDGIIDAQDENFSQIKIVKGDGSIITLEEAGIASINLNSNLSNIVDENGNTQSTIGSYTKTDGTTAQIGDYQLQNNKTESMATEWVDVPDDIKRLPNIFGTGKVYSLQQAMARDTSGELKQLVESFVNETDLAAKRNIVEQILNKWTNTDEIISGSRGENFDAKQLHILEQFIGEQYIDVDGTGNPNNQACNILNNAYATLKNNIYALLEAQTALKDIYNMLELEYSPSTEKYIYKTDALISYFDNQIALDPIAGKELLTDFVQTFLYLGYDERSNYSSFYDHFAAMGDEYKFLLETADKVVIYGTDNNDSIEGTAQDEAVLAGAGNDTIYTRQGNDIVYAGEGDDYIDTCENNDIIFGENGNDTILAGSGDDTVYGGDGNDSIESGYGNDFVYGGNGSDVIKNIGGSDFLDGGDGDDTIISEYGNSTFIGGKGNDYLESSREGDNTYIFNLGDGNDTVSDWKGNDTIKFGKNISLENVRFSGESSDLLITYTNSSDSIRVNAFITTDDRWHIENFVFEDGTTLTYDDVMARLVTEGDENDNYLNGSMASEKLYGYDGNDTILAGSGDDTIYGGNGNDSIESGSGNDIVYGESGNDFIKNEGGSDLLDGGDGDDTIISEYGNSTLVGGKGNDYLESSRDGDNTYMFNLGDGNDTVSDWKGNDTIKFGENISLENVRFSGESSDLLITYTNSSDSIRVNSFFELNDWNHIENFVFEDGTTLTYDNVMARLVTEGDENDNYLNGSMASEKLYGYDGNDTIMAGSGDDTIYGGDGNDSIESQDGNDIVYGGNGNDFIRNSYGNDLLDGGDGDDTIISEYGNSTFIGGKGNDYLESSRDGDNTYIFNLGDGNDTVSDWKGNDTIKFGENISLENVRFSKENKDLIITYTNSNDTIKVNSFFELNNWNHIENFEFEDGIVLTHDEIANMVLNTNQFSSQNNNMEINSIDLLNTSEVNKLVQDMSAFVTEEGIAISTFDATGENPDLMNLVTTQ